MDDFIFDLAEKLEQETEQDILKKENDPRYYYALSEDRQNVFEWMPLSHDMDVLLLGADFGAFLSLAKRVRTLDVYDTEEPAIAAAKRREKEDNVSFFRLGPKKIYDLVLITRLTEGLFSELSFGEGLKGFLSYASRFLKESGKLGLSVDNKDAIRFYSGGEKREDECMFSLSELRSVAEALPFSERRVYFPLPDRAFARDIFSESYPPSEGDFRGIGQTFSGESYALCDEEALYGKLSLEGVFAAFANSYILILSGYGGEHIEDVVLLSEPKAASSEDEPLPIYIRYNRGRDRRYRIKTEICEEKDGGRYVRKSALGKAANDHILSLRHKYELLSKELENKELKVLEPKIGKEPSGLMFADFEYLRGITLAKKLSESIKDGKAPIGRLKSALEFLMGRGSTPCYDLDLVFENVLITEDGCHLIDYEWTFDTPLERDHVKYRILRYWYEAYKGALGAYDDMADLLYNFGIKDEVLFECDKREKIFQDFVNGAPEDDLKLKYRDEKKNIDDIKEDERKLGEFTEWNLRLQDEVEDLKAVARKLRETERLSQNHIKNIEGFNTINRAEIERLTKELAYLERHKSLYARIRSILVRGLAKVAPQGSTKRKFLYYAYDAVMHPVKKGGFYLTKKGRDFIAGDLAIGGEFSEGGFLKLPTAEESTAPLVSIVIPAYNEVSYTYACIRSIIEHTDFDKTPYEVILADDVSTDATTEIGRYIDGLVISRNIENLGFLKNCNRAAALAKGSYLFFLNNDTKVTDGWLESLICLMEKDETIGLCGSKLVYPDGKLQEAGGIIWSDGSGWNYGRGDDPERPEYNYVKEVDYISGAAILIRRSLWEEIGGFDERYAPAYCEDSDLCFEVRRHGKRVVYQPKSVVIHFEGVSNGTDVNGGGLKHYQLTNNEKLKEKWAEEFKKQEINDGAPDPFTARDRSKGKKCILVIDHYVPTWDKDAGSRTTYQYIRLFLEHGYNVKFLGDNFLREEPYTSTLEQLGVEVLYGDAYKDEIFDWIKKNGRHIDIAFLNRPHIAIKYIEFIKENTDIKRIFYGHDLHFLRLEREYELTDEIRYKRESEYWKGVELTVMDAADMVYYPSEVEIGEIRKLRPRLPMKAVTAYAWEEFKDVAEDGEREGLLFVGGFAHPPNEDGVLWFLSEVYPRVREVIPEIKFRIVGSHVTEKIETADGKDGIEVLGYVSDERLEELYAESRLVVAPLRYGAGVKGKVVEALHFGAAVVTTEVGAEGIPDASSVMAVAGTEEAFAETVIRLYKDEELCHKMRVNAVSYSKEHYSMEAVWDKIKDDLG